MKNETEMFFASIVKEDRPVTDLIDNRNRRAEMLSQFDSIVEKLGEGGASERAAEAIYKEVAR